MEVYRAGYTFLFEGACSYCFAGKAQIYKMGISLKQFPKYLPIRVFLFYINQKALNVRISAELISMYINVSFLNFLVSDFCFQDVVQPGTI